ncbi:four-carbon acid sugar kinase family protein [Subtercola vilae]|uniref:Four-carbon acid sugar kinase family protein n=1 Tax=Subtercola vilae TaxID=2056433 RepID=A0A4V4RD44_9MICO|nr:four-carbon acid sugar kinase family protein [Subtercola vilae]TIH28614.1 four-carbon acid sugar kinase family protein [Subtercola vilae]
MSLPARVLRAIIADDLTGAADAIGSFGASRSSAIVLGADSPWPDSEIVAIDTGSRYLSASEAALLVSAAVQRARAENRIVFKKMDSLLRGNVGAELVGAMTALTGKDRGLAIVAPAFPATNRVTLGGVIHVGGQPAASAPFHGNIRDALTFAGMTCQSITSHSATIASLAGEMRRAHAAGRDSVIVDAVDDFDLEQIARAAEQLVFPTLLTGSGGLAAHLFPSRGTENVRPEIMSPASRVLVVVGSYSDLARSQVDELIRLGCLHVERPLTPGAALSAAATILASNADVVFTPERLAPVNKKNAQEVASALASTVEVVAGHFDALVLTGGETARAVLDTLGIRTMYVVGELEPGIVLSRSVEHLPHLVTKAGAFGDSGSLARTVRSLKNHTKDLREQ